MFLEANIYKQEARQLYKNKQLRKLNLYSVSEVFDNTAFVFFAIGKIEYYWFI